MIIDLSNVNDLRHAEILNRAKEIRLERLLANYATRLVAVAEEGVDDLEYDLLVNDIQFIVKLLVQTREEE